MTNPTPKTFVNLAGQVVCCTPVPGKPYAYNVTIGGQPVDFMQACANILASTKK